MGRILVVNDDRSTRALLRLSLEQAGYRVSEAEDGESALESLQHQQPDVILLDLTMPGMDGFQVLERLKADPDRREIPVLVVSASDRREDVLRSLEIGATDYLQSPVDPAILLARVRGALAWSQMRSTELDTLRCMNQLTRAAAGLRSGHLDVRALDPLVRRGDAISELAELFQELGQEVGVRQQVQAREMQELRNELNTLLDALPEASGGTILVVEDELTSRRMLTLYLERLGYQVDSAEDGLVALEKVAKRSYDTILLDLMMPNLDGYGVLERLKADPALQSIPVIVISANEQIEDVVRLIGMGAQDHLPKPFNPQLLGARVRASLSGKRARDQELAYIRGVTRLTQAAVAMESDENFDPDTLDDLARRSDAIGRLSRVFQEMAREVRSRQLTLKRQVSDLKLELEEARQRSKLADGTQTDYAQTLDTQALRLGGARIHVLASFRGGTGKSTVAANLAVMLAMSGLKVALLDASLQAPGLHVVFGLTNQELGSNLHDFLFDPGELSELALDLTERVGIRGSGRLQLLPATTRLHSLGRLLRQGYEPQALTTALTKLCDDLKLDLLLIDTQAGLNEEVLLTLLLARSATLVVRSSGPDLEGTAVLLQVAQRLRVEHIQLLVNEAEEDGPEVAARARDTLAVEVAGILPRVPPGGTGLFCLRDQESAYTAALRDMAVKLLQ